ncbi:alpha-L-rhamnosidase C-terminal domain-containing protein [Streptomyces sp. NPDC001480]|uniref:alpha-L-rhamnosidase C-terminal domain-containing protein n=1 Tax=Streptomyces sp. NPDC001480 TaxID=3364577 RepID=UPI003698FB7A
MTSAASHRTPCGSVRTAWTRRADRFRLTVDVPAGSTAEVHVPRPTAVPRHRRERASCAPATRKRCTRWVAAAGGSARRCRRPPTGSRTPHQHRSTVAESHI